MISRHYCSAPFSAVREWYGEYRFGSSDARAVYCPVDVLICLNDYPDGTCGAVRTARCYWNSTWPGSP